MVAQGRVIWRLNSGSSYQLDVPQDFALTALIRFAPRFARRSRLVNLMFASVQ